jgi:hypothetical protein
MKQALISSVAALLIAGLGTVGVGWYLAPAPPVQLLPVPKLPEGLEIAWRCDGMIIAIIENRLEGVSRGGSYIDDDVERTVWIYNPLQLPLSSTFMFKQYETAHPFSTWGAELKLPNKIRNLAKIVRLEKSGEFKRCLEENPGEHQKCRDVAEEKLK